MKILVYGAGVIGTLYAARLRQSGHVVTLLARGQRLADIRRRGLALEDIMSGRRSTNLVDTTERLVPEDQYDVALITVRRDQLMSVMPALKANRNIPTMLFMLNNPVGSNDLVSALGQDRLLLGFPGAGGTLDEHIFVTAVSGAIYMAGGDCRRLSKDSATLTLMTKGVREGFAAVRALGLTVTPFPLRVLFAWLPQWFAVAYWQRFFASDMADYVFGRHARSASREMREIASDCLTLLKKTDVEAPALHQLYQAIDAYAVQG